MQQYMIEEMNRLRGFKVEERTLEAMKRRLQIVRKYDLVTGYREAVWHIAAFLNGYMRFRTEQQDAYPELMVLAWHYAHKEFGCPTDASEYETFVEALRVDVVKELNKYVKGFVGMEYWYTRKRYERERSKKRNSNHQNS